MGKAALRRHRTDRPVRRVGRRGAQRPLDHGRNLIVVDGSRPARTSLVEQAIAAILQEAAPPFANCVFVQAELGRDGLAGQSIRTAQNDAAPLGERSADAMATHLLFQIGPLLGAQLQRRGRPTLRWCFRHQRSPPMAQSALVQCNELQFQVTRSLRIYYGSRICGERETRFKTARWAGIFVS